MIDNPLPDQVMQEREALRKAQDFEFYCFHHAKEIAEHYKVHKDLIRDYHKAKTDKDDELRRKIGAILNNTYLKKITFN